jgi:hypothetical protein
MSQSVLALRAFCLLLPPLSPLYLQNRRVQIDEFTFNLDKRDKLLKASVAAAEKAAKEKEKAFHR